MGLKWLEMDTAPTEGVWCLEGVVTEDPKRVEEGEWTTTKFGRGHALSTMA